MEVVTWAWLRYTSRAPVLLQFPLPPSLSLAKQQSGWETPTHPVARTCKQPPEAQGVSSQWPGKLDSQSYSLKELSSANNRGNSETGLSPPGPR